MMRARTKSTGRRGAAMVEAAIILPVFLSLCLCMLDMGMGVFKNNAIAEASRQGARIASVHGSLAKSNWNGGPWGPTTYNGAGNATDSIASTLRGAGILAGLNPASVTLSVQWPDLGNSVDSNHRVRVTASTNWTPLVTYIFGSRTITLTATSITPIAH